MPDNIKRISLGKKDLGLIRWHHLVTTNETRIISLLVRNVISAHIHGQNAPLIGKVCSNREIMQECLDKAPLNMNVTLGDPKIVSWLERLTEQKVQIAPYIKSLLKNSIILVDNPSDEWVPGYLDLNVGYSDIHESARHVIPQPSTVTQAPVHKPDVQTVNQLDVRQQVQPSPPSEVALPQEKNKKKVRGCAPIRLT